MAPQVGLEPTTLRLTAGCSAIELLRSSRRKQVGNYSQTTPLVNLSFPANMSHSAKILTAAEPREPCVYQCHRKWMDDKFYGSCETGARRHPFEVVIGSSKTDDEDEGEYSLFHAHWCGRDGMGNSLENLLGTAEGVSLTSGFFQLTTT